MLISLSTCSAGMPALTASSCTADPLPDAGGRAGNLACCFAEAVAAVAPGAFAGSGFDWEEISPNFIMMPSKAASIR
jgi:hypothetical protein